MRLIPIPSKTITVSHGEFLCRKCKRLTAYKHKERVQRVLAFFIVPILGDTIEEYIECQNCRWRFPIEVLRSGLSSDVGQVLNGLKEKLLSGLSIEEVQTMLLESGIDAPTVKRYVSVAAGIGHKHCSQCQLTFRDEVIKCHKCGHVLPGK